MDFSTIKAKALEIKNLSEAKAKEFIAMGATTLANSTFTMTKKEELQKLIESSKETSFTNKKTGETKKYCHKSIAIFSDEKSEFFKEALYKFPILATKAFSENISLKLGIKTLVTPETEKEYAIKEYPCIVVFENEKWYKTISGNENITKLVKSLDLNITE